jgi:hypothetical protein
VVGDILQDGGVFGEDFAIVRPDGRDKPERVDREEILSLEGTPRSSTQRF